MNSCIVNITDKGQLTLPVSIRRQMKLKKGTRLQLIIENNEIRLKNIDEEFPVFSSDSTFFKLFGSFEGPEDLAENHDSYLVKD